ncbi:MAG: succinate dehydrogenase, hydrophobic membrane anchor protein [Candidatus Aminicenantes bacterium]|nr:MAG: succinate dehydrogenase, hydrophobic membrane anchor protein [Candidatus Aminicenantes bacterium]
MKKSFKETSKAGAIAWLLQRVTAVILFIIVIYHFVYYHFIIQGVYSWKEVAARMQSPWFNLLQFVFLVTALYHGLNGIWMVTEDYIHGKIWRMIIFSLILILGLALFFVGILTIFKTQAVKLGV